MSIMNAITCDEWAEQAGWRCTPLPDTGALYVVTPLTMSDGKPLDFYLRRTEGGFQVDDDGMTLFALRGLGLAVDDRRNWRGIEGLARQFGFELTERGEIRGESPASHLAQLNGRILQLFSSIISWEVDRFREADRLRVDP